MGASQLWEESVEGATDSGEWMSGYSIASSLKDLAEITIGYLARCYLIWSSTGYILRNTWCDG